ncbi:MAG: hypothetical protein HYY93_07875 [Planctomycetes bacterium]|nr:hypothetical protein [Planctomycetota bacterium]
MFRALLHAACILIGLLFLIGAGLHCVPGTAIGDNLSPRSLSSIDGGRAGSDFCLSQTGTRRLSAWIGDLACGVSECWNERTTLRDRLVQGLPRSLFLLCLAFPCVLLFAHRRGEESASAPAPLWLRLVPAPAIAFALYLLAETAGAAPLRGLHGVTLDPLTGWERWLDVLRHGIVPIFGLTLTGIAAYRISIVPPPRETFVVPASAGTVPPVPPEGGTTNPAPWRIESSGRAALVAMAGMLCVIEPVCGWPGLGWMISRAAFQFDLPVLFAGVFAIAATVTLIQAGCEVLRRGLVGGFRPGSRIAVAYVETVPGEVGGDQRRTLGSLRHSRRARVALGLALTLVALILVAGYGAAPLDGLSIGQYGPGLSPSFWLPFGSDAFGRNVCSESLRALAVSLAVALAVTAGAMALGGLIGAPVAAVAGRGLRDSGWRGAPIRLLANTLARFPTAPTALLVAALIRPDAWGVLTALATAVALRTGAWVGSPLTPSAGWTAGGWARWMGSRAPSFAIEALAVETGLSIVGLGPRLPWPTFGEWIGHLAAVAPHPAWALLLPFLAFALALAALELLGEVIRELAWAP